MLVSNTLQGLKAWVADWNRDVSMEVLVIKIVRDGESREKDGNKT